jgi:hypothetical protein
VCTYCGQVAHKEIGSDLSTNESNVNTKSVSGTQQLQITVTYSAQSQCNASKKVAKSCKKTYAGEIFEPRAVKIITWATCHRMKLIVRVVFLAPELPPPRRCGRSAREGVSELDMLRAVVHVQQ